jgi:hypothetical protein
MCERARGRKRKGNRKGERIRIGIIARARVSLSFNLNLNSGGYMGSRDLEEKIDSGEVAAQQIREWCVNTDSPPQRRTCDATRIREDQTATVGREGRN